MADVAKKGWNGPHICILCTRSEESTYHIFLQCDFANHIWKECATACGITINISHTQDIWGHLENRDLDTRVGKTLVASICWLIWRPRNNRFFNACDTTQDVCLQLAISDNDFWTGIPVGEDRLQLSESALDKDLRPLATLE